MKLKLSVALNLLLAVIVVRQFFENLDLELQLHPLTPAEIRGPNPGLIPLDLPADVPRPAPTAPFRYHLDLRADDLRAIAR